MDDIDKVLYSNLLMDEQYDHSVITSPRFRIGPGARFTNFFCPHFKFDGNFALS